MRMFRRALAMVVLALLIGMPARSDGLGEVVVVTHIDIIPDYVGQAEPLLKQFVTDSRNDRREVFYSDHMGSDHQSLPADRSLPEHAGVQCARQR